MRSIDQYSAGLLSIWIRLFGREDIGTQDNFFELGGDSLLVLRLITAVEAEFGIKLSFKDVFAHGGFAQLVATLAEKLAMARVPVIKAEERPDRIPLSYSQRRLWFIDRYQGSVHYHIPMAFRLQGKLDEDALGRAFSSVIRRHEVLRTVVKEEDGEPYQKVLAMDRQPLSLSRECSSSDDLPQLLGELSRRPFELSEDPMLRVHLIRLTEETQILLLVLHHIAADGWSVGILARELTLFYNAFLQRRAAALTPLPLQYADYCLWQHPSPDDKTIADHSGHRLSFWENRLSGLAPLLLPTDHVRPAIAGTSGAFLEAQVDAGVVRALQALSSAQGCTLFMTLLTVFKVFLYRYTGQTDICVGSPVAGRTQQELEGLVGFFVNTLALRSDLSGDPVFTRLLRTVKDTCLEAFEYQDVPFERIVDVLVKDRDLSRHPVFQVMFTLEDVPSVPMQLDGLTITRETVALGGAKFELAFHMHLEEDELSCNITYSKDLFERETVARMMDHYLMLLRSVAAEPDLRIADLPMLLPQERRQLLETFNDTSIAYDGYSTVNELLAGQLRKTPEAVALIAGNRSLCYSELHESANRLGHFLRKLGIREEDRVAVCLDRSVEMIVAILGIMKAGAAYVPIDPQYPEERVRYMLQDSNAGVVITARWLEDHEEEIGRQPADEVRNALQAHHAAYVIYTSGSTGMPKGVINEHRGLVNRLRWTQDYFRLGTGDAVLQKTTFCFDVSVWEICWPLFTGARLVLADPGGQYDVSYLKRLIDTAAITTLHFVPSMLPVFLEQLAPGECRGLRRVLCSGEALQPYQIDLFRQRLPAAALYNLYGPTEAAIDVSCWAVPPGWRGETAPIGNPVANTQLYVLDHLLRPVPAGITGELFIGGVQVARGYLNRQELTAEKFITDPFSSRPGARLYRTGDMARWRRDGQLEYIGRKDEQVKIRGYRIEPGEIEQVLIRSGFVKQGVVLAGPDREGGKRLIAYIVPEPGFSQEGIRDHLATKLPDFMIPVIWVVLERLPLNANGKLDRKALPDPQPGMFQTAGYIPPRNETEKTLAGIWQELLNVGQVGVADNFFTMGGHSLLAMRLVSAIAKKMHVRIPVNMVFQTTTISLMARFITVMQNNTPEPEEEFSEVIRL